MAIPLFNSEKSARAFVGRDERRFIDYHGILQDRSGVQSFAFFYNVSELYSGLHF